MRRIFKKLRKEKKLHKSEEKINSKTDLNINLEKEYLEVIVGTRMSKNKVIQPEKLTVRTRFDAVHRLLKRRELEIKANQWIILKIRDLCSQSSHMKIEIRNRNK